jgi:hypothetical protein
MTVDVALAALWAGFAVYTTAGHKRRLYPLMIAAPLVRETGLAMAGAFCLWSLLRRDGRGALAGAATALPFAGWLLYVQIRFGAYSVGWLSALPLHDLLGVVRQPFLYPWETLTNAVVIAADLAAVAGSLLAIGLAFRSRGLWSRSVLELSVVVLGVLGVVMALFGSRDIWVHVYGHARLLSPLLVLLALRSLERKAWSDLSPLPLVAPRIGLQFASDALRVLRGVTSL